MQLKLEDLGGLKCGLDVEVPFADVAEVYHGVYQEINQAVRVRGFRKGKLPAPILKKRFEEAMREQALQKLIPQYFQEALEEKGLRTATVPEFSAFQLAPGEPFAFRAVFEKFPAFDLPDPEKITLPEREIVISPEEVQERILGHRQRFARREERKGPAIMGDTLQVRCQVQRAGEAQAWPEERDIELGKHHVPHEVEEALLGAKAGESRKVALKPAGTSAGKTAEDAPKDAADAAARDAAEAKTETPAKTSGESVIWEVEVLKVMGLELPAWDTEFFRNFQPETPPREEGKDEGQDKAKDPNAPPEKAPPPLETEADFQAWVRRELEQEKREQHRQEDHKEIARQLKALSDFPVPQASLEALLARDSQKPAPEDSGANPDPKQAPPAPEDEEAQREKHAATLRLRYLVDAWAKENHLEPEPEVLRQRFMIQCYFMRQDPQKLANSEQGQQLLRFLHEERLEFLVLDFIAKKLRGPEPEAGATP